MGHMVKVLTSLALVLLWLSATVVDAAFPAGLVLCHGADGHVALEPAHAESCQRAPEATGASAATAPAMRAADCTDVPVDRHLSGVFAKRLSDRSAKRSAWPPALFGSYLAQPPLPVVVGHPGHGVRSERPFSPHLAHLQTVVLRL